ncbi:uncharacterized protein dtex3l2.1 [Morone saxatilis]|uniref:uncharacterized protein dtex3l2.1 n=1 Tax=Morone saxatilis TaxID=34816 RepID=UPI0015E1EB7A|nr:uncharacterized protein dtex3l2.1 [Morone saxatilis]
MMSSQNKDEALVSLCVKWSRGGGPWKLKLDSQQLLQSWFSGNLIEVDCAVLSATTDGSVVMKITPASALAQLWKLHGQTLTGKDGETVTIMSVSLTPPELEEEIPDNASMDLPSTFNIPMYHYWYVNQAYKEEIKHIERESGVKIMAEVKLTFEAHKQDGNPNYAFSEFINLVQKCSAESRGFTVPLKNVNAEQLKDTLKILQRPENKLLLNVSSEEMTVCGPRRSQDAIRQSLNADQEPLTNTYTPVSSGASQDTSVNLGGMDVNKDEVQVTFSVKWSEGIKPQKAKVELQKVLQTWANRTKCNQDYTVLNVLEDGRAVIKIKPAPALLELQKLSGQTLTRKKGETVTIMSVSLTPPDLETRIPDNASMTPTPSAVSKPQHEEMQLVERSSSSSSAAVSAAGEETSPLSIPVGHFWYVNHIYKEEIKRTEKDNGVKIMAEVNVTFEANQKDGDGQKARYDFITLVQKCLGESEGSVIPLKYIDPEEFKDTLKIIQRPENKLLLTVSSEDMTVCGPRQSQDAICKSLNAAQKTSNAYTLAGESSGASQETPMNIGRSIKDPLVDAGLTIEESYWKLMTTIFDEDVSKIKAKFGVDFKKSGISQGKVKVKAHYKGSEGNAAMESHAVRALLQLYQKIATSHHGATGFSGSRSEASREPVLNGQSGYTTRNTVQH